MSDFGSKEWFGELLDWGAQTSAKLIENALFKKDPPAAAGGSAPTQTVTKPGYSKWLPYGLIGGALIAALFLFKGHK